MGGAEQLDDGKELVPAEIARFIDNALRWGLSRLGSHEYPGRCLAFVEDCYEKGSGIEIFGGSTASESAGIYEAYRHTGQPPAGAFVFFGCSGPLRGETKKWGHVGLALGNGNILHAWDCVRVDPLEAMEVLNAPLGWSRMVYTGWAPPKRVLEGHKVK